jgi:hypothetical protein
MLQMYRKHHNGQLSIEEFHVPFGGTLDPDNRWVLFSSLGLPRFGGQVSGLHGFECTGVDELLLVVDRAEVTDR